MSNNFQEIIETIEHLERCSRRWYDGRIVQMATTPEITGIAKKIFKSISLPENTEVRLVKCKSLHDGSCELKVGLDSDYLYVKIDATIKSVSFNLFQSNSELEDFLENGITFPFNAIDHCFDTLNEILSERTALN
jgi:hypothetical protein